LNLLTGLQGLESAKPHVTANVNIRDNRSISCLTDAELRFVLRFVTLCNLALLNFSIVPGVISPKVLPPKLQATDALESDHISTSACCSWPDQETCPRQTAPGVLGPECYVEPPTVRTARVPVTQHALDTASVEEVAHVVVLVEERQRVEACERLVVAVAAGDVRGVELEPTAERRRERLTRAVAGKRW
jgi:hypothetical protein